MAKGNSEYEAWKKAVFLTVIGELAHRVLLAMFQRMMESLLQGLPAVTVYLDDILITGRDKKEHYDNFRKCLRG